MLASDRIKPYFFDSLKLNESWKTRLAAEIGSTTFANLWNFLEQSTENNKVIYPADQNYFNALNSTDFEKVKVVILGQDPYHGPGQAHGLSFSVPRGIKPPPSLVNIFKELSNDMNIPISLHGCLESWAHQGVLLLNSVLSVELGKPASHQGKGWESFTDRIISALNEERSHLVFILWGAFAQKKAAMVDRQRHFVIESVHPSPLSCYRGFLGSKPFSKANQYLKSKGLPEIDWSVGD